MGFLIKPKKSLGQNFLRSEKVLQEFVESCDLSKDDFVLEVGAGTGTITCELAKRAGSVIAIEFDKDLIPQLKENLRNYLNIEIINGDILSLFKNLKIEKLISNFKFQISNFKIVGAIPYDITSPLIHAIYNLPLKPLTLNLIVQKEVAQKICAKAPNASYLSNLVASFGTAKIIKKIPPGAFYPAPKVHSAILKICVYQTPDNLDIKKFSDFLHRGFKFPRKKIKQVFDDKVLLKAKIDPNLRPSNLTTSNWNSLLEQCQ
ncbi:ribosomal RNA small subunit methyltransferase A [candidate division WWE3 bacterium CG08_land_8_20_14_0_20_40_13]|uniref:Ribosomal RNA small subunit methyltransferase A n=1 Tax=candidate division WWE3 bacterium CG08_land_8_20_14_0_20_40_13 TaxID=1975084 RepID=A0A2H0XEY0_UNCKA|nr:MAG: ribosomal RNA small subunit methyltransferase A [candidate division WWE3 bacterium CG08_land_8_20_14_0_20_40_13]